MELNNSQLHLSFEHNFLLLQFSKTKLRSHYKFIFFRKSSTTNNLLSSVTLLTFGNYDTIFTISFSYSCRRCWWISLKRVERIESCDRYIFCFDYAEICIDFESCFESCFESYFESCFESLCVEVTSLFSCKARRETICLDLNLSSDDDLMWTELPLSRKPLRSLWKLEQYQLEPKRSLLEVDFRLVFVLSNDLCFYFSIIIPF